MGREHSNSPRNLTAGRELRPVFFICPCAAFSYNVLQESPSIMQAVILAAGKGVRMNKLTEATPKPMLRIGGRTLLELKIREMPAEIDKIIILIGYLGEQIRNEFGNEYLGKQITYVTDNEIKGTGAGLWKMKDALHDRFLVMMGDDIYSGKDMKEMLDYEWALLAKRASLGERGDRILLNEQGTLCGFMNGPAYVDSYGEEGLMNTGMYMLSRKIFEYPLVKLRTREEWGLPQTILGAINDIDLKIIETDFWIQISNADDLERASGILKEA
jgi:NDP-sugar pyrophosphorylase family protein